MLKVVAVNRLALLKERQAFDSKITHCIRSDVNSCCLTLDVQRENKQSEEEEYKDQCKENEHSCDESVEIEHGGDGQETDERQNIERKTDDDSGAHRSHNSRTSAASQDEHRNFEHRSHEQKGDKNKEKHTGKDQLILNRKIQQDENIKDSSQDVKAKDKTVELSENKQTGSGRNKLSQACEVGQCSTELNISVDLSSTYCDIANIVMDVVTQDDKFRSMQVDYWLFDLARVEEILVEVIHDSDYKSLELDYSDSAENVLEIIRKDRKMPS